MYTKVAPNCPSGLQGNCPQYTLSRTSFPSVYQALVCFEGHQPLQHPHNKSSLHKYGINGMHSTYVISFLFALNGMRKYVICEMEVPVPVYFLFSLPLCSTNSQLNCFHALSFHFVRLPLRIKVTPKYTKSLQQSPEKIRKHCTAF